MIESHWRRVAGLQVQDDGTMAAAWLAHDKESDTIHLYDCAMFRREVLAVVAEGINARGRWIPLAWHKDAEEIAEKLLDKGCNTMPEVVDSSQPAIEADALDIWERMRTKRFKVENRLGEWIEEFRTFYREENKVPVDTHPLMAATRNAYAMLDYARRQSPKRGRGVSYPRLSTV